jgi:hypothetical protein
MFDRKEYYKRNRERLLGNNKRYQAANKEKVAASKKLAQAKIEARRRAALYDGKECLDCGTTTNLDYHHLDPATKLFSIGRSLLLGIEKRKAEIAKCVVVCRACHKQRHVMNV